MKVMGLREAKQTLSECVSRAQKESVLITRHGKPAAVVVGVAGRDFEDVTLQADPRFWEMIEARRKHSRPIPEAEVRRRLGLPPVAESAPRRASMQARAVRKGVR